MPPSILNPLSSILAPKNRLILWTALIVLPFAAVGGTLPGLLVPAAAAIALFFLIVLGDAVVSRHALDGLAVEAPDIARLQKDRTGELELVLHNPSQKARLVRIGLAFPPEIEAESDDILTTLPAGVTLSRLPWRCTARRRGQFILDTCHLEATSPLGLWARRTRVPAHIELRVYPDLAGEHKNAAALFLNRGASGIHSVRQLGKGREFEKLRDYVHGDSSEDVHWKASAKRRHLVTKVFQIERTQEVYVVLDASRLTARAASPGIGETTPATVLERFVTAALLLGMAAQQQSDLFGLITFSDRVHSFVRAKTGKAHYDACRDAIYRLQPSTVTPDFEELCSFIRLRLRKRALLIVLTALDDPVLAASFTRSLDLIRRQHLVLVNMFAPPGAEPLFSTPDVGEIDTLYEKLGGHLQWHDLRELDKVLQRRGVPFHLLTDERMTAQLVSQYMSVRARQLV